MEIPWVGNLIASVIICGLFAANAGRVSDGRVSAFSADYRLELTAANVELVRGLVTRSRNFRLAGAAIGTIAFLWLRGALSLWSFLAVVAVGFAFGSIADELTRPQPQHRAPLASLERRTVRTYVQRWLVVLTAIGATTAVYLATAVLRIQDDALASTWVESPPPTWWVFTQLAAVAAAGLGGAVAVQRIVRAPNAADGADRQAARHVVRMAGVLSVIGAMNVVFGSVTISLLWPTTLAESGFSSLERWVHLALGVVGTVSFVLGISTSLRAFPRPPIFRRTPPVPQPAPNEAKS